MFDNLRTLTQPGDEGETTSVTYKAKPFAASPTGRQATSQST